MVKAKDTTKEDGFFFLGLIITVLTIRIYPKIQPYISYFQGLEAKISSFFAYIAFIFSSIFRELTSNQFRSVVILVLVLIGIFMAYIAIVSTIDKLKGIIQEKKRIRDHKKYTEGLLKKDVEELNNEEIQDLRLCLENDFSKKESKERLRECKNEISLRLQKEKWDNERKKHKEDVSNMENEKRILNFEIEELEKKKRWKEITEEQIKTQIAFDFERNGENAIHIKTLSKREIDAVIEHEFYSRVNEYCIHHKKVETFLVKKFSNHSPTHTFLVWNVEKLLKGMKGIRSIHEHGAVDADITFIYHNRKYALEIETGTLLSKKKQLDEKIKSLNRRYPKRWMIVVSNKNLVSKYRKFGPSTQRTQVAEKLQKLLNSYTRPFRVD